MLKSLATVVLLIQVLGKAEARVAISPMEKPGILQNDVQNAGDERALPPAYLSVPNFRDCMGSEMLRGSSHVCLLLERPPNCPQDSFEKLRKLGKVILSCQDTHQNQSECGVLETIGRRVFCPMHYDPVCGTDGKTYGNHCEITAENCRTKANIRVASKGKCGQKGGKLLDFLGALPLPRI